MVLIIFTCSAFLVVLKMMPTWTDMFTSNSGHAIERPDGVSFIGSESIQEDTQTGVSFSTLLADYHKQLKALKDNGNWKANGLGKPCDDKRKELLCIETNCNGTKTLDPEKSLRSILNSMKDLDLDTLKDVTRHLKPRNSHRKILFVTAASSNHYLESQTLLQNLHDNVFPHLTDYSFVYYDIGLTVSQRKQLERFCRCEVRTFPLHSLPARLQDLNCYTWKPLIINTNLPTVDTLIWTDSSVRFRNGTILDFLEHLEETRLSIWPGLYPIAYHTQKIMFDYFGEQTCSFSDVPEVSAGFAGYKNDRFVREVVIKPWTACAVSPNCMCFKNALAFKKCGVKTFQKYNYCHRYDQSALSIILSKLFRGHELNLNIPIRIANITRGVR